jgi:hypothetical protein
MAGFSKVVGYGAVAMLALFLVACGAAADMRAPASPTAGAMPVGANAPMPPPAPPGAGKDRDGDGVADAKAEPDARIAQAGQGQAGGSSSPKVATDAPHGTTMLIYTATLHLAVFQVEQQMNAVERIAREAGGYLSVRNDTEITIRVPRGKFEPALHAIEKLGDVVHRSVTAQDVTDEYVDLEIRLKNNRAVRDRLQALLDKAGVKEAIEIQKELARVTEEIERMEGRLKLLKDKIAFSSITVSFQPVDTQPVRDATILPFPWLQDLGLSSLLNVHP